jgi:hypothetical protein
MKTLVPDMVFNFLQCRFLPQRESLTRASCFVAQMDSSRRFASTRSCIEVVIG